jgi:hypothetical protein
METKHKALYDSPTVTVVELKLESGVLTVSTNNPESRGESIGNWGDIDTWF